MIHEVIEAEDVGDDEPLPSSRVRTLRMTGEADPLLGTHQLRLPSRLSRGAQLAAADEGRSTCFGTWAYHSLEICTRSVIF